MRTMLIYSQDLILGWSFQVAFEFMMTCFWLLRESSDCSSFELRQCRLFPRYIALRLCLRHCLRHLRLSRLVTGCRARMYTTFTVLSGLGKVRSDSSPLPDSDHPCCSGPLLDLFQISMCGREQALLEGRPEPQFSSENYITLYTCITCKEAFEEYIIETVLPSLREKHDEFMFSELAQRWINYKIMVRWLSRFFHYLDRCFISRRSLPALKDVGLTFFRELVSFKGRKEGRCWIAGTGICEESP